MAKEPKPNETSSTILKLTPESLLTALVSNAINYAERREAERKTNLTGPVNVTEEQAEEARRILKNKLANKL